MWWPILDLFLVTLIQALAWCAALGIVVGLAWTTRRWMGGGR